MKQTDELIEGNEVHFWAEPLNENLDSISFSTSTNYVTALIDLLGITVNRETRITGSSSPSPKSDDTNSLNPADHSRYRRAVGMLQWIVPTRPDMTFATNERARALASPTNADMTAPRHFVRYYRTTSDLELRIQPKTRTRVPEGEPELFFVENYSDSDSDWTGCRDTLRSTSGGMIFFEGAVLTFWSRTQTTIVLIKLWSGIARKQHVDDWSFKREINDRGIDQKLQNEYHSVHWFFICKIDHLKKRYHTKNETYWIATVVCARVGGQWNIASDKGGNIVKPCWHFHEVCEFRNDSATTACFWFAKTRSWYIRFMPLDVFRQIWLKFARQKAHETRAMTIRNFDITKFLEAERPKYDVKTFDDPYRMAMNIVNDDEVQSVHDFQALGEKASITDLLKVKRIGTPHDTQLKMIRVWEEYERFTLSERDEYYPIPQWYGKAIRYDDYELDESLTKARFYEPPLLTILDKLLLTNTKMMKAGKSTNEYVFVPLDYQYDDESEIMNMGKYSHLVFHENYETAAVFGAIMMPSRGTLTTLTIWKQSIQTTLDKMIRNCRGRYQVWYEDREKTITSCQITPEMITPGMTDYTTVFEIDEKVVMTAKIMTKCEMNTELHWSIFNDDDAIFPNTNCISSCDESQLCKWKSEEWMPGMCTTVDGRLQDLQGPTRDAEWWSDEYDTIRFWFILDDGDVESSTIMRISMTIDQSRRPTTPIRTRTSKWRLWTRGKSRRSPSSWPRSRIVAKAC